MTKLVVLIPAYNEEDTIIQVIKSIPRKIPSVKEVKVLVINDGSTDRTADYAFNAGADKIVSHRKNLGVGAAFMTGIRNAIEMDADMLVTLDGDSQFDPKQISDLIVPILNKELDVVIGSRFLNNSPKMPRIKKFGNRVFSRIVSWCTRQHLTDSQTGFRAYSREAMLNVSVVNDFTYTQEVLIDLSFKGMRIGEVPVLVKYNENRKSRVVKSVFNYSYRALSIIIKSLVFHRPILAFGILGLVLIALGTVAKITTITNIFVITAGLSTGIIILGIVSFMMGLFASVVFKRQSFAEKDLRHYVKNINQNENKEQG